MDSDRSLIKPGHKRVPVHKPCLWVIYFWSFKCKNVIPNFLIVSKKSMYILQWIQQMFAFVHLEYKHFEWNFRTNDNK